MKEKKSTLHYFLENLEFSLSSSSRPIKGKKIHPSIRQTSFPSKPNYE